MTCVSPKVARTDTSFASWHLAGPAHARVPDSAGATRTRSRLRRPQAPPCARAARHGAALRSAAGLGSDRPNRALASLALRGRVRCNPAGRTACSRDRTNLHILVGDRSGDHTGIGEEEAPAGDEHPRNFGECLRTMAQMEDDIQSHHRIERIAVQRQHSSRMRSALGRMSGVPTRLARSTARLLRSFVDGGPTTHMVSWTSGFERMAAEGSNLKSRAASTSPASSQCCSVPVWPVVILRRQLRPHRSDHQEPGTGFQHFPAADLRPLQAHT
jgi:hypothetical protein